jgi:MFS family permease
MLQSPAPHDPYAAFRIREFRLFMVGSMIAQIGGGAMGVAVGWEVYQRTGEALALGLTGLIQAVPMLLLTLPAGYLADIVDRRKLLIVSMTSTAVCALALAVVSWFEGPLLVLYALLFCIAVTHTLGRPARAAFFPLLVPRKVFENSVAWRTSLGQIAAITGPAIGGFIIAWSIPSAYVLSALAHLCLAALLLIAIRVKVDDEPPGAPPLQEIISGIRYVWNVRVLLLAMALDLFAVLLGGAVYLLPIYATKILCVGEHGLGWLRAAPAMGAFVMALFLAHRPPMKHAGRSMLIAVAGFGVATIIFGVSRSFWLSMGMLFLTGMFDNISVVVRHTMIQLLTPNRMRGRVSAVSTVFIGSSNELGGFESGIVAHWFGPVVSVVSGGIGTLLVVGAMAFGTPHLRRFGSLSSAVPVMEPDEKDDENH